MKQRRPATLSPARPYRIVFVTAPSRKEGSRLARGILERKLAACVNLIPGIRSWYWWKRKVASSREVLLVIKTHSGRLQPLHRWIRENHPYEVPEFLAFETSHGDARYLQWLLTSLS